MTVDVHMHWLIDLKIICFFVVFVNGLVAGSSKSYIQKSMSCYHWAQQTDFFLLFFERSFCVLVDYFFLIFWCTKKRKSNPIKRPFETVSSCLHLFLIRCPLNKPHRYRFAIARNFKRPTRKKGAKNRVSATPLCLCYIAYIYRFFVCIPYVIWHVDSSSFSNGLCFDVLFSFFSPFLRWDDFSAIDLICYR